MNSRLVSNSTMHVLVLCAIALGVVAERARGHEVCDGDAAVSNEGSNANTEQIVADGRIREVSDVIGKLIRLRWLDKRVGIDRDHWGRMAGEEPEDEKQVDAVDALIKRGIPAEIARKIAQRGAQAGFPGGGRDFLTSVPEGEIFAELKTAAGAMSGGGGSSGDRRHWNGHGIGVRMEMRSSSSDSGFYFSINEETEGSQELIVEDHQAKGLRIQFTNESRLMLFSQSRSGVICAVNFKNEAAPEAIRCRSYAEMQAEHPEFSAEFKELMNGVGIRPPLTLKDERVLKMLGRLLHQPGPEVRESADAAIAKLGAESFGIRESAEKEVQENYRAWESVIRAKLNDPDASAETRMRLEAILSSEDDFETLEAEEFIRQRKLLDNADYLASIAHLLPESLRPDVENHIELLRSKPNANETHVPD